MHTEHLHNVRIRFVLTGWLIAIAVASLLLFILIALKLVDPDSPGTGWVTLAVALGFLAGGAFVGFMTALAPILHGILIGVTSIVAWAVLNAVAALFFPDFRWTSLSAPVAINVILLQIICAVLGTRFGYRWAVARVEP